ncbi:MULTISPECIES: ArsD-related vicinal cysteine protein VcpD [unclassified Geobacillus]|uniref:ArsD-related vicinal cysteine protein VcpD n=1 Tax=unclassified Geobacillus TaxID=2642459 RepID=UPI00018C1740|nr:MULTISPECIES: hypothetical protein [unclassified Geobacillus]ADI26185.1 hypothetical protein GC56T3_1153 [Geobacillus sp. C56-T3]ADU94738.1 hypothetical protein GYMC52_2345 [Geobacillus sp. Y412MC52]ALA71381.1 hypothetical protein GT50_15340 [Geobacillus stearothermophilus 10]
MKKKLLVELFPKYLVQSEITECTPESVCCDTVSDESGAEMQELKQRLLKQFKDQVIVQIYNYQVHLDLVLAQKKLTSILEERGFKAIASNAEKAIQYATPAVIVNGKLLSLSTFPRLKEIYQYINDEIMITRGAS